MATIGAKNIGVIENAGPNNLKAFIKDTIKAANKVDIGVAFITVGGLEHVSRWLKKAGSRGTVRVLTGFYQCFTEPAALRKLLELKSQLKSGRFEVRVSTDKRFHWKAYFFFTPSTATIAIGSSNLTNEGLKSSGEINFTLRLPRSAPSTASINDVFESEWARAAPLTTRVITLYEQARPDRAGRSVRPLIPLSKILASAPASAPPDQRRNGRVFWRDAITGYADDETEQAIYEETDWDEKGYQWFSTGNSVYGPKDRIVLFDTASGYVELAEVVRTTQTIRRTLCGRHFAAYQRLRGSHRRRINRRLWAKLRQHGTIRTRHDVTRRGKLSEARFAELVDFLGLIR
ncbi:MAG TPA: phospholipase D-like domain-containing protein [Humisphaera sp.]|jgi:HKD family nuclease|nr:phospholipase D-like domain-containing protein [Humisphaera sp.]